MKKISILISLLFIFLKSYSQYYDTSYFAAYEPNGNHHSSLSLINFDNDKYGNRFCLNSHRCCLTGYTDYYITWSGPSGQGSFGLPFAYTNPQMQMCGDALGHLFALGTYDGTLNIYGTSLYLNAGEKALIKTGNPGYAFATHANNISVNDSGYCFAMSSDSIKLYSPSGLLLWTRSGSGNQIYANNNLSYIVGDFTGIKKYHPNGTVAWQSALAGNFRVTPNHRVIVKQGGTVYELNAGDGQTISIHAGATQGSLFDNEGNGYSYSDSTLTKYDSTGVVWQTHLRGSEFAHVELDMHNNIYFANNYTSSKDIQGWPYRVPVQLFVPPALFQDPYPLNDYQTPYFAVYVGKINQQNNISPKITTSEIKALCKESTTPVPFTVNKFHVGYAKGFRAELSDTAGSFNDPLVIGTGFRSPITANTPFFNISGNKYKIRVVANTPEVIGKPAKVTQLIYPPKAEIILAHEFPAYGYHVACAPSTLYALPSGNYTYQWLRKLYGETGYSPYYGNNDSITLSSGSGDGYKVIVTDTSTGCSGAAYRTNFYIYSSNGGIVNPDFYLPNKACSNDGPIELSSDYGGTFSGDYVWDNKFYPDSAAPGLYGIHWQISDPPSCFAFSDTTKYIKVDTCTKAISNVHISPFKEGYCSGDTITVSFDFDSTLFNPGNKFKAQLSKFNSYNYYYPQYIIGVSTGSPVTCVIPAEIYNDDEPYRIRVFSTDPLLPGAFNIEGNLEMGKPSDFSITVDGNITNCAGENAVIQLSQFSWSLPVYSWHFNNQTKTDSILLATDSYSGATVSYGSSLLATQSGNYSVEITDEYGCHSFSDTVHIGNSLTVPDGTVSPASASFCQGDSALITLTTDSINLVEWSDYSSVISPPDPYNFYLSSPGGYSVKLTNPLSGCFVKKQNVTGITVKQLPYTAITPAGPTTICAGEHVTLSTQNHPDFTYKWLKNNIAIAGATSYTYNASSTGTYRVRIIYNTTGCIDTTPNGSVVTVNPLPAATITAQGPVLFCAGDSVDLSANTGTGYTYKWKKGGNYISGATAADYIAKTGGNYKVEVTDNNGCSQTSGGVTVTINCRESTGENELNTFNATVFPNPSDAAFNFDFTRAASDVISIEISDITGRSVFKVLVSGAGYVLKKEQLCAGVYSAVISDGNKQEVIKLVKTD